MRLVLVHGRGQGGNTADELRETWLGALNSGLRAAGLASLDESADVQMAFYGDLLQELTNPSMPPDPGVELGVDSADNDFQAALILEIARRAGVTDADIDDELTDDVELGWKESKGARAAGRALDKRAPRFATWVVARLMPDVDAYLNLLHVRQQVNGAVTALLDEPAVVVGHSLGSIVAYWVLTEGGAGTPVPLLVTLGSPLGSATIKSRLLLPLGKPAGVKHWFNAADERDPIALVPRLDRDAFPAEIENISDVHNPEDDHHGISGYLADRIVARRISEALR